MSVAPAMKRTRGRERERERENREGNIKGAIKSRRPTIRADLARLFGFLFAFSVSSPRPPLPSFLGHRKINFRSILFAVCTMSIERTLSVHRAHRRERERERERERGNAKVLKFQLYERQGPSGNRPPSESDCGEKFERKNGGHSSASSRGHLQNGFTSCLRRPGERRRRKRALC